MEWQQFDESPREYPEKVVEEVLKGFPKATKGLLEMILSPANDIQRIGSGLKDDFQFIVNLRSQYLKSYSLRVFTFGYGVELAPIHLIVEESIAEELFGRVMPSREIIVAQEVNELRTILEDVFKTQKFLQIVTGVMKIARRNQESQSIDNKG